MKTLLLLLLPFVGICQVSIYMDADSCILTEIRPSEFPSQGAVPVSNPKDWDKNATPQEPSSDFKMLNIRLSILFFKYKLECFADSAESKGFAICTHKECVEQYISRSKANNESLSKTGSFAYPGHTRRCYKFQHRQPTFEGFMEYVDKLSK